MRVAFYESDITPPLGDVLLGSGLHRVAEDVFDRLYAKAMVVEDGGTTLAVVTMDVCEVPVEAHDIITERIHRYTSIPKDNIMICALHTHKGAPVYDWPAIGSFADRAYLDVFLRICADTAILAYKRLDEADVKFGRCDVCGISHNRTFVDENGTHVTWGKECVIKETLGPLDTELAVMTFERNGKPVGAVINYALHQDCLGAQWGYSGDYSSVISQNLKNKYGSDFVSFFVLGACGDINHMDAYEKTKYPDDWYRTIGNKLSDATCATMDNSTPVEGGIGVIKKKITVPLKLVDYETAISLAKKYLDSYAGPMRASNLLYYYQAMCENSNKTEEDIYVQCIKLGDVCIYALPGEVFCQIALDIKSESPFSRNMVIELCNINCGYIPDSQKFCDEDDLYECCPSDVSRFAPETADILISEALGIAKKLKEDCEK